MRWFLIRAAGGAMLVSALTFGAANVSAAGAPGATPEAAGAETADAPDALPAGAIPQAQAQQDALKNYPGGTAVFDSVNDSNGTITYGFAVTAGGKTYDVQVDALKGTVVQADANDGPDSGGADSGAADAGAANQ
jgi:uncharacterized membrane protein YkoI